MSGWRLCPHIFGWSYIPSKRRRFCRLCAKQQRLNELTKRYEDEH